MIDIKANKDNNLKYQLELNKKKKKDNENNIIKESKAKEEVIEYFTE